MKAAVIMTNKGNHSNLRNPAAIHPQTWLQTGFLQALERNDVLLKTGHGDISKYASNHVNSGLKPLESVTHELRVIHLTVKYGRRAIASMPYFGLQLVDFTNMCFYFSQAS